MTFLDWLFRTSWQVAALVLLILAAQQILGSRLSPRWRYALWWVVVLRLVLPPISIAGLDLTPKLMGGDEAEVRTVSLSPVPEPVEPVTRAPPQVVESTGMDSAGTSAKKRLGSL